MKLVLYSGGQSKSNHILHETVVKLAKRGKKSPNSLQLTYIPFCSDGSSIFYNRAIRRYRSHGVKQFYCLNPDESPNKYEIQIALESDIIYLAGGNTFYFLHHLRRAKLLEPLAKFAKRGGVIAGLSAGGLIMSPTVRLAADKGLGPDENEVGVKNFKAMGLFDFEFSPHFDRTKKLVNAHLAYSKKTTYPIYAIEDGGGIVIDGQQITLHGKGAIYHQGTEVIFNP